MWRGVVESVYIAPERGAPTVAVGEVRAVPGQGLEGDRNFGPPGTVDPASEATLVEIEALEALARDYDLELDPGASRRNIVTRGVPLNHLVGRTFRVGEVTLRGLELSEPCAHLASLTHEQALRGLVHRGGLRAQILAEGMIRPGDAVEAV